jgi:hypothetical protein
VDERVLVSHPDDAQGESRVNVVITEGDMVGDNPVLRPGGTCYEIGNTSAAAETGQVRSESINENIDTLLGALTGSKEMLGEPSKEDLSHI